MSQPFWPHVCRSPRQFGPMEGNPAAPGTFDQDSLAVGHDGRFPRVRALPAVSHLRESCASRCTVGLIIFWGITASLTVLYVHAWGVWWRHINSTCDEPLRFWLWCYLVYCAISLREPWWSHPAPPRLLPVFPLAWPLNHLCSFFPFMWAMLGSMLLDSVTTCKETSPELYKFVQSCTDGYYWLMLLLWAYFVRMTIHWWLLGNDSNEIDIELTIAVQERPAQTVPPEVIGRMESVSFKPALFANPEDPGDPRPAAECCVCLQLYDDDQPILRTLCGHLMHRECLASWLQVARTCPTCRADIERPDLTLYHPEQLV